MPSKLLSTLSLGEIDSITIELNKLYYNNAEVSHELSDSAKTALTKDGRTAGVSFIQNVADRYVQKEPEEAKQAIKQYLGKDHEDLVEYNQENKTVKVNIGKIVNKIEALFDKDFPESEFTRKFKIISDEIEKEKSEGVAEDKDTIQNTRLAGWLVEQLHILTILKQKEKLLEEKKIDLAQKKQDVSGVNVRDLNSSSSLMERIELEAEIKNLGVESSKIKKAYQSVFDNESYEQSSLDQIKKNANYFTDNFKNAVKVASHPSVVHSILNPLLAGLATKTKAEDTLLYSRIKESEKNKIPVLFKKFGIDLNAGKIDIKALEVVLNQKKQLGFLTDSELKELMEFYKNLAKKDEQKEEFVNNLQTKIDEFNSKVQKQIDKAEVTDDDLNKLRLIQAALILSPFFGVSLVPLVANTFLPFFEGQEIADWLSSFLSSDGPLSWLGITEITDAIHLDDAVGKFLHLFDGVLSVPETILTGENNPIAILYRNVIGQGLANSPFGNWLIAAAVDRYSHYFERESKLSQDKSNIRKNAEKDLNKLLAEFDQKGKSNGFEKRLDIIKYRTDLAIASKMSVWLSNQYLDNSKSNSNTCEELIDAIFKADNSKVVGGEIKKCLEDIAKATKTEGKTDEIKKSEAKASEEASLKLLRLFNDEFHKKEPTKEFKQLFELCFAKNQDPMTLFLGKNVDENVTVEKKFEQLNQSFKDNKEDEYDKKLEILKARETLELAGHVGIDTGYPICYGDELLYLNMLSDLELNNTSLATNFGIPEYNQQGETEYRKNKIETLVLLSIIKKCYGENDNLDSWNAFVSSSFDQTDLKQHLINTFSDKFPDENMVNKAVDNFRNIGTKKCAIAIHECSKDEHDWRKAHPNEKFDSDKSYNIHLKNIDSGHDIENEYEELKFHYDKVIVKATDEILKEGYTNKSSQKDNKLASFYVAEKEKRGTSEITNKDMLERSLSVPDANILNRGTNNVVSIKQLSGVIAEKFVR